MRIKAGEELPGMVLAKEIPAWFSDITPLLAVTRKQLASLCGIRAGAAFPIWAGKKIAGVLEFFSDQASEPDEPLQEVMALIGVQIGRVVERKQMENEMAELQRRLMDGREAERVQLARELHDGPVQDLYGVSFNFKAFCDELPEWIDKRPTEELQAAIHKITRSLRQITGYLRPPTLAHFGLEKAIRSHASIVTEDHPNLQVLLDLAPDGQALPEIVRLALFRIYQHSLTNVLRHARATRVEVRLEIDPGQVRLEIQDNGVGFVMPARWIDLARDGHLGLAGAAERAQAIGGQMQVESTPGQGTKISVTLRRPDQPDSATQDALQAV
jgi:signal transduction histidine kinase